MKLSRDRVSECLTLFGFLFFLFACSESDSDFVPCETEGETAECVCLGGEVGVRVCRVDLTFGRCECLEGMDAGTEEDTEGGTTEQRSGAENDAGLGVTNQTPNTCYRCLNDDPWFILCNETVERSSGTIACVIGDDVQECATISQCCAASYRRVTEAGICEEDERTFPETGADITLEPALMLGDDGTEFANLILERPVALGRFTENVLKIKNSGTEDLSIRSIEIEGKPDCDRVKLGIPPKQPFSSAQPSRPDLDTLCDFAIEQSPGYATSDRPLTVPPGGEIQVVLSFKALDLNPVTPETLIITSNAEGRNRVRVKLSVRDGAAQLSISRDSVSFSAGEESTETLLFRNSGTSNLVISSWRIVPLTETPFDSMGNTVSEFRVLDEELPEPFQISANNSQEVRIRYTPIDEGQDEAQLVITSNSSLSVTSRVFLTSGTLSSELVAQPNPVIFDDAAPTRPSTKRIAFRNAGLRLLSIQGITITPTNQGFRLLDENGGEIDISDPSNPRPIIDIRGGDVRNLSVVYEPTGGSDLDGTMVVRTTADNVASDGGQYIIPLRLSGADIADLEIDKLALDFSNVADGQTLTQDVTLTNPGGRPLNVARIGLSTDMDEGLFASDSQFAITAGGEGLTLAPGASHTVTISFTRDADDRNRRIGALVIDSDASTGRDVVYLTSNPPL